DLAIHPREHDLVIGTFGRAAYVLDDIRPFRAMAKEGKSILDKPLYLFTPPNAFITQNQEAAGTRFGANAIFNGENKPRGAMITYSINRPETKKSEETSDKKKKDAKNTSETNTVKDEKPAVKFDSIFFQAFNDKNELIRSISSEAPKENGVHRFFWNLDEKGENGPSRRKEKPNSAEPRGVTVLPGTYAIKIHFGNHTASENIKVAYDPRVDISFEVLKSKYDLLKQLEAKKGVAGEAAQRLLASKEIVEDYQKRIKALNKDAKEKQSRKDTVNIHSEISKKIEGLLDAMMGKEDKRQGITATEFPSTISYLYTATGYVNNLLQKPGQTELTLVKNADEKVSKVIAQINEFYKADWVNYKNAVEKLNLSPFKELGELKY
ncbi:MAG: hypothetical protein P1P79_10825, partial [Lutibacter sp.]|nr:hypothetical protein [Lutibacter sp.]